MLLVYTLCLSLRIPSIRLNSEYHRTFVLQTNSPSSDPSRPINSKTNPSRPVALQPVGGSRFVVSIVRFILGGASQNCMSRKAVVAWQHHSDLSLIDGPHCTGKWGALRPLGGHGDWLLWWLSISCSYKGAPLCVPATRLLGSERLLLFCSYLVFHNCRLNPRSPSKVCQAELPH